MDTSARSLPARIAAVVATGVITAAVAGLMACGGEMRPVCEGEPARYVVVPMTSKSDLAASQRLNGPVTEQVIERVVRTCGSISVAVAGPRSEAQVVLRTMPAVPDHTEAYNPKPVRRKMTKRIDAFVRKHLTSPLSRTFPTATSPFFGVASKVAAELSVRGLTDTTLVLIGDGIVVESAPSGALIDFRRADVPPALLREFRPLLKGLDCVMLVGLGAGSNLPSQRVRAAGTMLKRTFESAGATFVATSSPELPDDCGAAAP